MTPHDPTSRPRRISSRCAIRKCSAATRRSRSAIFRTKGSASLWSPLYRPNSSANFPSPLHANSYLVFPFSYPSSPSSNFRGVHTSGFFPTLAARVPSDRAPSATTSHIALAHASIAGCNGSIVNAPSNTSHVPRPSSSLALPNRSCTAAPRSANVPSCRCATSRASTIFVSLGSIDRVNLTP